MKLRFVTYALICGLTISTLFACSPKNEKDEGLTESSKDAQNANDALKVEPINSENYVVEPLYDFGVELGLLKDAFENSELSLSTNDESLVLKVLPNNTLACDRRVLLLYTSIEMDKFIKELPENPSDTDIANVQKKLVELSRPLICVTRHNEEQYNKLIEEGKKIDEITGNSNSDVIGKQDGFVYVYSEPTVNDAGLSEEAKKRLAELVSKRAEMRSNIKLIPTESNPESTEDLNKIPDFTAKDLDGNAISNAVFADKKLTMVNFWGTFCGPCIDEMPDLGAMSANMPEGTKLIGVIVDANSDENINLAKDIVTKTSAKYPHIIPEGTLSDYCMLIEAVPTTIFVDKNGNKVGDAILGSKSKEDYLKEINDRLATMKE